jgi:hypothetical protein
MLGTFDIGMYDLSDRICMCIYVFISLRIFPLNYFVFFCIDYVRGFYDCNKSVYDMSNDVIYLLIMYVCFMRVLYVVNVYLTVVGNVG